MTPDIPNDYGKSDSVSHYHVTTGPSGQYQIRQNAGNIIVQETFDRSIAATSKAEREGNYFHS